MGQSLRLKSDVCCLVLFDGFLNMLQILMFFLVGWLVE